MSALVLLGARSSGEEEDMTFLLVVTMLPHTCLLGDIYIYMHLLQLTGLIVLSCLNHLCCWVQAGPLAGLYNQWVWAQLLREHLLFSCSLYPLQFGETSCEKNFKICVLVD